MIHGTNNIETRPVGMGAEKAAARRRRSDARWMLAVLGCLAVLTTAFSLMLPAITMTRGDLLCDLEEHSHSAACYEKALVCGQDEAPADEDGEGGHEHTAACYEKVLTCGEEAHKHGEACYDHVKAAEPDDADGHANVDGSGSGQNAGDAADYGQDAHDVADVGFDGNAADQGTEDSASVADVGPDAGDPAGFAVDGNASASDDTASGATSPDSQGAMPAQSFTGHLKDKKGRITLTVNVEAPEGAFPANTYMHLDGVAANDIKDAVGEAIAKKTDGKITQIQAVDITFREGGPKGAAIEPACDITVRLTSALIAENEKPLVVHVDDKGKADVVVTLTKKELKKRELSAADDELLFDSDKFSTYGIVITTLEQTLVASDGKTYTVTVTCPSESGVPADAALQVEEVGTASTRHARYVSKTEDALGLESGTAESIRLFDIKIVDGNGEKVEIASSVSVNIELAGRDEQAGARVVHFADGAEAGEVVDGVTVDGENVSFEAAGFSIYAVVDDGAHDENARIGYRFWYNDGTQNILLSTQHFRYKDVHPAEGTDPLAINEPRIPDIEATTWTRIFRGWSKGTYLDDGGSLTTVSTLNSELSDFTQDRFIEGEYIDVYANLKDVYYVTYVDVNPNNVLATEIVPKAESGDTTFAVKPETQLRPTIDSDTELLGWYDINHPETVYPPGQDGVTLASDVTLYPKVEGGSWLIFNDNDMVDDGTGNMVSGGASFTPPEFYLNEVTHEPEPPTWAGYEFGGWYTTPDCTTPFAFGQTLTGDTTVYAKWTPSDSAYRVIIWKQRASDDPDAADDQKTYDYVTSELIDTNVVTGQTVTLADSYKNIYGSNGTSSDADKAYFTYNAGKTDQSVVVKADGSSVLNVYYDRKPVTLNFYTWDYTYTQTTGNGGTQYGYYNGEYIPIYYNNGTWYRTRTGFIIYNYSNPYSGPRYTRSNGRSWNIYKSFSGLYGSTLEEHGYSWPSEHWWYENGSGSGTASGIRTTVMTAFLPTDNKLITNFYGSSASDSGRYIRFYIQSSDGSYDLKETIYTGGSGQAATFHISDKYIGYHAAEYRVDSNSDSAWNQTEEKNSEGYYGDSVRYTNHIDIRFDLNDHTLAFYTNNGHNGLINYTVPYNGSISEYSEQSPGQYSGHYFQGWYADPGCTEPFDFSQSMPDNNIAVYGKWRMERVRVVIEPGAPNVYMGSQATTFRLDYDETIAGGLLETATRAGYILDGWYTDPDFTNRFLFSNPVNSSIPGVDMTYHDSPTWAAARAAYGDDTEAYENVRGILHLYAKWIPDPNSIGINVVYDPGEAALRDSLGNLLTTVPIDTHMYGFDGTTTAREAPSNYNDLYTFSYWEATKPDGSTVVIHPGDPVGLGELAYSDPVYDPDTGELLRGTVTLRAVYELTGDPSRITHITFDGNTFSYVPYSPDGSGTGQPVELQGQTRDGTHRHSVTLEEEINQTIKLPTEEDWYLDGYTLVGWAFTEGDYASQTTGQTAYSTTYEPGASVAADNLVIDQVNDQGNTLYAMWQPKTYTVTVKQVIEDGVSVNAFTYAYKTGVDHELANAAEQTNTLTGNSSFTVDDLEHYNRVGHAIHVTTPSIPDDASYDVRVNAIVVKDDGTTESLDLTALGNYPILGDVTITYTYSPKALVKLRKRDATNHNTSLTGAEFTLTPVEYNTATAHWETAGSGKTVTVNAATLEQYLQEGTYRVTEIAAPNGYAKIGTDLYLTVDKDDPFTLFMENGHDVSPSIAELANEGKALVVYDNPIRTVTLSKQVEGGGEAQFAFKVTVFNSDDSRLGNYAIGQIGETALVTNNVGEVELTLGDGASVALNIPHGCKLQVAETPNASYEASYVWNSEASVKSSVFGETPVSITANGTLAFTNSLVAIPVTLVKVGVNNTDAEPTEQPLAGATFTAYTAETGGSVATGIDASGNTVSLANMASAETTGVFFTGKLKVGTYYLEETSVPAGYNAPLGRFKLEVKAPAAAPTIATTWVTGDATQSAGTVSGNATDGYTVTVRNVAGVELPHTGGAGTGPFYAAGLFLALAALALLVRRRIA